MSWAAEFYSWAATTCDLQQRPRQVGPERVAGGAWSPVGLLHVAGIAVALVFIIDDFIASAVVVLQVKDIAAKVYFLEHYI